MAGGRGRIDEYNKSLTPEQRKLNAKKAGSTPRRVPLKTIREIARVINDAPAQEGARAGLEKLGLDDADMTNAALIAAAVFRAAFEGNMNAVEKWERYVGQAEPVTADTSAIDRLDEILKGTHENAVKLQRQTE